MSGPLNGTKPLAYENERAAEPCSLYRTPRVTALSILESQDGCK